MSKQTQVYQNNILTREQFGVHRGMYSAEASSLGWEPGYWPNLIYVEIDGYLPRTSINEQRAVYGHKYIVFND